MTYKHVKFEDSPVMRSLEKVAQQKGMIKNESLTKTAAVKKTADLVPSDSLLDNVLKLCSGLRERGFEKQANELETYLVNYKRAQTMYDTHGEKGEDVIQTAHPKGSHKLENVDSDEAVFEDILDQMAKTLQVVNKEPTGKLSSQKAIEAVKVTLGARPLVSKAGVAELDLSPSLWSKVVDMFGGNKIELGTGGAGTAGTAAGGAAVGTAVAAASIALSAIVGGVAGYEIFENKFYATDLEKAGNNLLSQYSDVEKDVDSSMHIEATAFNSDLRTAISSAGRSAALAQEPTPVNLGFLQTYIDTLQSASQHAYKLMVKSREKYQGPNEGMLSGVSGLFSGFRDVEIAASNFINVAQKGIADARLVLNKIIQGLQQRAKLQSQQSGGDVAQQLISKMNAALKTIDSFTALVNYKKPNNQSAINNWLANARKEVTDEQVSFSKLDPADRNSVANSSSAKIDDIVSKLNAFKNRFLVS